ncbi:MAG: nicotinate phosphoribosyltransferase [Deltaproteobacteria bacterium]|jgi:nicotinate phosphoribosyltransferase|nr:nicotinate phosphoribosyltransferase [Deltaproteobacteria bacterium]MBT4527926.1 nicotinate phosphoribosyltransferase [Deltaproteobacteria bacterium]
MIAKLENHNHSISLLTDLYQLTMAYGYWNANMHDKESVFHMYYRTVPFKGRFCIACGLEDLIAFIDRFTFDQSDQDYLASLRGSDQNPLFTESFIRYLGDLKIDCDIDAVPEGTPIFPNEPIVRVQGSIIQCQLLESVILNIINFQTLIATKAVRICHAAQGDEVLEFGLRRAQGLDGALSASRAAYIGGCMGTSNVLAGKMFGIPVKGTMAHSWIMAFEDELEAFKQYAEIMPNNCVFLVDTYSTLSGVSNAIRVGKQLKEKGYQLAGIRLDSGDLAYLSIEARKLLDKAGFKDTLIVVSNELDESLIQSLKIQKAKIDTWGVGTKLVTSYDQPALNGVYKLSAIRDQKANWNYKIKISDQKAKVTTPGVLQVRRYYNQERYLADMIYNVEDKIKDKCQMIDPHDSTRRRNFDGNDEFRDLLVPVYQKGEKIYQSPVISKIRSYAKTQVNHFHPTIRRLVNPHHFPVGEEQSLNHLKRQLIIQARQSH